MSFCATIFIFLQKYEEYFEHDFLGDFLTKNHIGKGETAALGKTMQMVFRRT